MPETQNSPEQLPPQLAPPSPDPASPPASSSLRTRPTNLPPWLPVLALASLGLAYFLGRRSTPAMPPASQTSTQSGTASEAGGEPAAGEAPAGESGGAGSDGTMIRFTPQALRLASLVVAPVKVSPQASGIPFNGQIEASPNGVVRVASVVPGRITRLLVNVGASVRAGQTLAVVESRAIGEAQSAYQQAQARLQNAISNFDVVQRQARAGVFSRAPVEAARRAQVDAQADVRTQETAVRQAQVALDNVGRLARVGSFASPALEAARGQASQATEALKSAQAALSNAQSSVESAQSELERRRQLAASGSYTSRPVEQARQVLVAAQAARAGAQSEVATTRANLSRAKVLAGEGLVSQRDLEAAQQAFDTGTARLETAQEDEATARTELARQQKLAGGNVAGIAEVQAAQSAVAAAQADVRTRTAEVARARDGLRLANVALSRERAVFGQSIANRREISGATSTLDVARTALLKARQTLALADEASGRERRIFGQNLNDTAQVQGARSTLVAAQSEARAARSALSLLRSSPSGTASVPIEAPLSGTVQAREVAPGESVQADQNLLTIVNLDSVAVSVALPEGDIARVRVGSPITMRVDALPNRAFAGRISLVGTQLDPQTRSLRAQALLPNASGLLRPGMSARGQIETGSGALGVSVPSDAIQTMNGEPVVFVPGDKAGEFQARPVQVGESSEGLTPVHSGLRPGEKIVVQGAFTVKSQAMKGALGDAD